MHFQYKAKQLSGKLLKGTIEANSKAEALSKLEKEGYLIFSIEEAKAWNRDISLNRKMKWKEFVIFLRQYATLIQSGIPIATATKTMIGQTNNKQLKTVLEDVDEKLSQGVSLSKAISTHPKVFPELLVHMIEAGEASGKLDEILNQMATYYEKQHFNRQRIVSALLYPSVVGIITFILAVFLLVFVVPKFISMFESFGQDLPAYTQLVVTISHWTGLYGWTLGILAILFVTLYRFFMKKETFAYKVDMLKLKIPIFGSLLHKGAFVRTTQTLSTLFQSGVPILQAVEITEKVIGNRVIEDVFKRSKEALKEGESMTKSMKDHWVFPNLVTQMIQIGEQTGTLDAMLLKVANFYEEEMEQLSERIKTLIEPFIIVVLAVVVGGIILAIVLPMFSLFENF